jgi:hypothetical protein
MCTAVLIVRDPAHPPPPASPRFWAHIRGRYWSAKIDDISLRPPAYSQSGARTAWTSHLA